MNKGNVYAGKGWGGKEWMFNGRRIPNQLLPRVWPIGCPCLVTASSVQLKISAGTTQQTASGASYGVCTEGEPSSGMHPALR